MDRVEIPACSHKRDSKQSELTQTGHRNLEGAVGDGIYKDKCKRCGSAERKDQANRIGGLRQKLCAKDG
jgi:hypothetical protein